MAINPITAHAGLGSELLFKAESLRGGNSGATFGSMLAQSIQEVQSSGAMAQRAVTDFLSGDGADLHDVAIASQKAELSMELFLQSRNKLIQAYQEVMRMQI